jgi:hypothetical protein
VLWLHLLRHLVLQLYWVGGVLLRPLLLLVGWLRALCSPPLQMLYLGAGSGINLA